MQCSECSCTTGSSISASHLAKLCWAEPTIDRIGLNGVLSLCILVSLFNGIKTFVGYLMPKLSF